METPAAHHWACVDQSWVFTHSAHHHQEPCPGLSGEASHPQPVSETYDVINDHRGRSPKDLCRRCLTDLQTVELLWFISTESFQINVAKKRNLLKGRMCLQDVWALEESVLLEDTEELKTHRTVGVWRYLSQWGTNAKMFESYSAFPPLKGLGDRSRLLRW